MKLKKTERKKARIEIIPLIDVIMFLLATFVLFTLTMDKTKNMPIDLPGQSTGQVFDDVVVDDKVTIGIDAAGDYFWNGERVLLDDIIIRMTGYKAQSANPKVIIQGEVGAEFGLSVPVLDEGRKIGLKITLDTQPKQSIRQ